MSRGPWIDPTYRPEAEILRGRVETDTLVVGAGVGGAALAARLADDDTDVVVIDAGGAGQGATGRSAGYVLADGSECHAAMAGMHGTSIANSLRELGVSSREMIRAIGASHDVEYTQSGSLRFATDEGEAADLRTTAETLGEGLTWAESDQLPAPWDCDGRFLGGLIDTNDGTLDPVRLVGALLSDLRAKGRIFEDSPVVQLQTDGPRPVVYTEHGHVMARRVVLCTNAWTGRLLPSVGPIQPVRAQMLEARVTPDVDWPIAMYARRGADYWRSTAPGHVIVGGSRDAGGRAENVDVDEPTAPVQAALDKMLRSLLPEGCEATITRRWAGLMGFTPDGLPVAGEVPGHSGVWALCGFNGHGIGWAPALAERVASALSGNGRALAPCYSPSRFAYPAR